MTNTVTGRYRLHALAVAAGIGILWGSQAQAKRSTLLREDFSGATPGTHTGVIPGTQFQVTEANIDVVGVLNGNYFSCTRVPAGNCLDLVGDSRSGAIRSVSTFDLSAGTTYVIDFGAILQGFPISDPAQSQFSASLGGFSQMLAATPVGDTFSLEFKPPVDEVGVRLGFTTHSAQAPSVSAESSILQPTEGRVSGSSVVGMGLDARVDLRPVFKERGLSTRAQGTRGTCSAFTVTRAIEYALGKQQRRDARLSVEFLNWASNRAIRERRDGGFFSDLWKGFEKYGICNEGEMPYTAEFDPGSGPSGAALAQARQVREAGLQLHWIKSWDPNRGLSKEQFAAVKKILRQQWPVCGGFLWPKEPEWEEEVLQMASRENVRDGHSVLLVGFRDDCSQPGGGVFLIQNTSKGPRDGAMSYEYVRAYMNDAAWIGYEED